MSRIRSHWFYFLVYELNRFYFLYVEVFIRKLGLLLIYWKHSRNICFRRSFEFLPFLFFQLEFVMLIWRLKLLGILQLFRWGKLPTRLWRFQVLSSTWGSSTRFHDEIIWFILLLLLLWCRVRILLKFDLWNAICKNL
jgi:hypothetical protein